MPAGPTSLYQFSMSETSQPCINFGCRLTPVRAAPSRPTIYGTNIILVSKKLWDRLSPTEQKILQDAAIEARDYQRQVSRAAADKAVGELQAKGMQFNEVAPAEQQRMREIAKPVVEKALATYDPAIQKLYASEVARVHQIK